MSGGEWTAPNQIRGIPSGRTHREGSQLDGPHSAESDGVGPICWEPLASAMSGAIMGALVVPPLFPAQPANKCKPRGPKSPDIYNIYKMNLGFLAHGAWVSLRVRRKNPQFSRTPSTGHPMGTVRVPGPVPPRCPTHRQPVRSDSRHGDYRLGPVRSTTPPGTYPTMSRGGSLRRRAWMSASPRVPVPI